MLYTVPILTIPLPDKAIGNLFAGLSYFKLEGKCGSGCGWWGESPIYFSYSVG